MKRLLSRVDEDELSYWLNVAVAVFMVWQAGQADDHDSVFYLFAATYFLIHAHGRRILSAVNRRDKEPCDHADGGA